MTLDYEKDDFLIKGTWKGYKLYDLTRSVYPI